MSNWNSRYRRSGTASFQNTVDLSQSTLYYSVLCLTISYIYHDCMSLFYVYFDLPSHSVGINSILITVKTNFDLQSQLIRTKRRISLYRRAIESTVTQWAIYSRSANEFWSTQRISIYSRNKFRYTVAINFNLLS